MTLQEAGLSRYPEWEQYERRSGWLLPPVLEEGASSAGSISIHPDSSS
jgi:hypothetical protein